MFITRSFLPLLSVAAAALATAASASARTLPAEELHTDSLGNLVWSASDDGASIPSLGRPHFSAHEKDHDHHDDVLSLSLGGALDRLEHDALAALSQAVQGIQEQAQAIKEHVEHQAQHVADTAHAWIKEANVHVDGVNYNRLTHPHFPSYALRISTESNSTVCDPGVKQFSGYLDISDDRHLWFTFFEARNNPKDAPVAMWLNGGPGCSSSTGLLFELGSCRIADEGQSVVNNPYSWTNNVNMFYLDQPVGVGYSYSTGGDGGVNNTPAAAEDVYAFLQLFFQKYDAYSKKPFTIVGESYAGHYIPNMGSTIFRKNKELAAGLKAKGTGPIHINLATLAIGNGLTEPLTQFASVPEFACSADNPYAIFKNGSSTCLSLEQKGKTCESLVNSCYKYQNRLTCLPAALYCWSNLYGPAQQSGLNLYDVRMKCDRSKDGDLCYKEMGWMETYLNKPEVKKAWGASSKAEFKSCNMAINQNFMFQGDSMHNSAALIPELVDGGVRVLIYAGAADFMCNALGNERWVEKLETSVSAQYAKADKKDWKVNGKTAGWVRSAGEGAGSVTFVHADAAGHMFPHDQPENALDMWEKWVYNKPIA